MVGKNVNIMGFEPYLLKQFVLTVIILFFAESKAQEHNFTHYSIIDGLSNEHIFDIAEDYRGYLWIGTNGGGINIFDGKEFQEIDANNGLLSSKVLALFEDKQQNMWIGTFEGLYRFQEDSVFPIAPEAISNKIFAIDEDSHGNLWLGTDNGVYVYRDSVLHHFGMEEGLHSDYVRALVVDQGDNVWIGTEKGVNVISNYEISDLAELYGFKHLPVRSLHVDLSGRVLIGYKRGGAYVFDKSNLWPIDQTNELSVHDIVSNHLGQIWMATSRGIFVMDAAGKVKNFGPEEGLGFQLLYAIEPGFEGDIWIGGANTGLHRLGAQKFIRYSAERMQLSNEIYSLAIDEKIWMGTHDGLLEIDKGKQLVHGRGIRFNDILIQDKLLFAASDDGLYSLNKNKLKRIDPESRAYLSLEYFNGCNYAGTFSSGLIKFNKEGVLKQYFKGFVINFLHSSDKSMWVCTENGLYEFDLKGEIKRISGIEGDVKTCAVDPQGDVWAYVDGKGLIKYSIKTKELYRPENWNRILRSKEIESMTIGEDFFLWMGTHLGILRIDLNPLIQDHPKAVKLYEDARSFSVGECLDNALLLDQNNCLWVGTVNGALCYNYKESQNHIKARNTYITGVQAGFDKVVLGRDKGYNFDYKNNRITFQFLGLTYNYTGSVEYQYKMIGLEENWSPPTQLNAVTYSALEPGDYEFQVRSSFDGMTWSSKVVRFPFSIQRPYYKSIWFYFTMILTIIVIALFVHRLRILNLNRTKRLLEEQVVARTVEIVRQKEIIEQKNKDITDSIRYAKKIQEAVLPLGENLQSHLSDSFIFYRPKDIVSGDFYWFNSVGSKLIVAAVDCTGHGVPGALMSMIGNSLMKETVVHHGITDPAAIINELNKEVANSLKQKHSAFSDHDGMDIGVMCVDLDSYQVCYAGANRPMYLWQEGGLKVIKGNPYPVGGIFEGKNFVNTDFKVNKGDRGFLSSDGFADQFGGPYGKKFMSASFKNLLGTTCSMDINEQKRALINSFDQWKGGLEQVDDVLVIGMQF